MPTPDLAPEARAAVAKWTAETPTKAGFYWFKTSKEWIPTIVEIHVTRLGPRLAVFMGDADSEYMPIVRDGAMWAGPIEPPADALERGEQP